MDEHQMIKLCSNNDRKAQEFLFRKFYPQMRSLCLRFASNANDAEILANSAFLKVFQNIGKFKETGSFEGWIKRIFINTCIDFVRGKNRTIEIVSMDKCPEIFVNPILVEDDEEILNKVEQLPTLQKLVLKLFVIEGYSHQEIAQMVGISEGASRWHLHTARQQIKNRLEILTHCNN